MKLCTRCGRRRSLKLFNRHKSRKDGYNPWCKSCNEEYLRRYFRINGSRMRSQVSLSKQKRREVLQTNLIEYLIDHPCSDCGETNIILLDFDHIRGNKKASISKMLANGCSWANTLIEISKCVVRCTKCHRLVTAERNRDYRWRYMQIRALNST